MDELEPEFFHNALDDEIESNLCPTDYIIETIVNEESYKPYSHELDKEDLKYISNKDWDLYK